MIAVLLLAQSTAMPMPSFLSGCWEQRQGERWTEECWTDGRGDLMIGAGREGNGDQVRHWEWMRIERQPDGGLTFYASPTGAPAVEFKASEASESSITFTNASHDFLQRVGYVLSGKNLQAEISLVDGSRPVRWIYTRTASGAERERP